MNSETRKITIVGMLCAVAFVTVAVGRVPLVLFLKYDPKDVVITMGGLLYGPMTAFLVSVIVSFIEMITISDSGILGLMMNIISSSAFACTAAMIYTKKRTWKGAVAGMLSGWLVMVMVMLLWNYLIAPIYMGYPREAVVKLLLPAFLPFNVIKGGLNAGFTLFLYKPVVNILRRNHLLSNGEKGKNAKAKINRGVVMVAIAIIITCILLILVLNGKI